MQIETNEYKPFPGVCRLCLLDRPLLESHIIPRAYYRRIARKNSGKLVSFDLEPESKIRLDSKQWKEKLLCAECEGRIDKFETYSIPLLRKPALTSDEGIKLNIDDPDRLSLFFTSIFWRAAVSRLRGFEGITLPNDLREQARLSLLNANPLVNRRLTCLVRVLVDTTKNGFTHEHLREFLISPCLRVGTQKIPTSFLFVVEGLLLEFFVPRIDGKRLNALGVVRRKKHLFFPSVDMFSVPELVEPLAVGYGKNQDGLLSDSMARIR